MDYLDPKKKQNKKARLMVGYALLGVAISMATILLVYIAQGFDRDPETGAVIQNGLIYVDSKPESASVLLNGELKSGKTDARLVVPEGTYDIEMQREGYEPWTRSLTLQGGSLRRITYARLIPTILDTQSALNLPSIPSAASQSNDKRWLVMAYNSSPRNMRYIDLNAGTLQIANLSLPVNLIEPVEGAAWEIIEWADDNKTFLARYGTPKAADYVLIDRSDPSKSVNIASQLPAQVFSHVEMRDRKRDLVFLYNDKTQVLITANVSAKTVQPLLKNVIDFRVFGRDRVLYVTDPKADDGLVSVKFIRGNDDYLIRSEFRESETYLLEMAQLGGAMVIGIGSPLENRVIVYNDPVNALKQNDFSNIPVPTTVLRINDPQTLSISADSSVVLARSGIDFVAHEFEEDRSYTFKIEQAESMDQELEWADGQHFIVATTAKDQIISDFDGSNQHILAQSEPAIGSYFDASLDDLYTFEPKGEDTPPRLIRTFMRSAADR